MSYYVYILRCEDGSLYTGITTEPARRLRQHRGDRAGGARYTALRRPLRYEAVFAAADRAAASRLEYRLKQLGHAQKEALILGRAPAGLALCGHPRLHIKDTGEIEMLKFICYPKCSTCKKAQAFLDARGLPYELRDIRQQNPSEEELREWQAKSGLPLKRFFNTSGNSYKALGLASRLPDMAEEEQFALLAGDGMLVKRPLLVGEDFVLVGFREKEWEERL